MHGWRVEEYGRSAGGLPLRALLPHGPRRGLDGLLLAALHGEEAETLQVARRAADAVDGARSRWAIVLAANPDGVLAGTRQNGAGVDLNRNFPSASWSPEPSFTYPPGTRVRRRHHRTSRSSPGRGPGSEPEVQALLALVDRLDPALVVDLHAPLAIIVPTPAAPVAAVEALAAASGLPVHHDIGSPTPGALRDWCAGEGRGCITYEVEHAPLPALLARHVPGLAGLLAGDGEDGAPLPAVPVALRHRDRLVARVLGGGREAARIGAVDAAVVAAAQAATRLAALAAAVPHDLPDHEADRHLEHARRDAGITWHAFRDLQSAWEVVLADGSLRPVRGPVRIDAEGLASWEG